MYVGIALWQPSHGSLELAEGLFTAGESYVIQRSLNGLLSVAVHLFLEAPIEDSQPHLLQRQDVCHISASLQIPLCYIIDDWWS
jgi:hypothetical protein